MGVGGCSFGGCCGEWVGVKRQWEQGRGINHTVSHTQKGDALSVPLAFCEQSRYQPGGSVTQSVTFY